MTHKIKTCKTCRHFTPAFESAGFDREQALGKTGRCVITEPEYKTRQCGDWMPACAAFEAKL